MSPVPDLPDPDAIAAAVASCPSVSGLSSGLAGEIATYLPGRRVSGVRAQPDSVEVHVIARYGATLHEVESQVRGAVTAAVGEAVRVDVVLADVEDPFAPDEEEEPPPALEAGPSAALPAAGSSTAGTTGTPGSETARGSVPASGPGSPATPATGVSPPGPALPTPPLSTAPPSTPPPSPPLSSTTPPSTPPLQTPPAP